MLSVPELLDIVRADFLARGITAEVIFGGWKKAFYSGSNRVVVGLGDFDLGPPGEVGAPGVRVVDSVTGEGARYLFARGQIMTARIQGQAPDARDPKRSENAQRATAELLHQFLRALYVASHGSIVGGRGTWPQPQEGGQDFLYGSIVDVSPVIAIPVLDDKLPAVTPDAAFSVSSLYVVDAEGGEELVSQTP